VTRRTRPALLLTTIAALLVAVGCSGPAPAPAESPTPAPTVSTSPTPAPSPSTDAEKVCLSVAPPGVKTEDVTIRVPDGPRLNAIAVGSGSRGVVLLHQTDNGLCGWLPYAYRLAGQGFHVLAFDFRCTFGSSCAEGEQMYAVIDDVDAAVGTLRKRGARQVALVGASYGGAVAIGACTKVDVSRCAALSAALFDNKLGGGVTANKAIAKLRRPLLFAAAPDDSDSPIDADLALVARAPKGVATFVQLPAGAGHGWDTVFMPGDLTTPSPFAEQLESFLSGRTC
jgi:dienelactone hydrolase